MLFINVHYRHYKLIMLPLGNFNKTSCWAYTAVVLCNKIKIILVTCSCTWSPALHVLVKRWFNGVSCHSSGACTDLTAGGCDVLFHCPLCPSVPYLSRAHSTYALSVRLRSAAAEQVHQGTGAARPTSSLLQLMVRVKGSSSLQMCVCAGALLAGQGRWLQPPLLWVVEVFEETSRVPVLHWLSHL